MIKTSFGVWDGDALRAKVLVMLTDHASVVGLLLREGKELVSWRAPAAMAISMIIIRARRCDCVGWLNASRSQLTMLS